MTYRLLLVCLGLLLSCQAHAGKFSIGVSGSQTTTQDTGSEFTQTKTNLNLGWSSADWALDAVVPYISETTTYTTSGTRYRPIIRSGQIVGYRKVTVAANSTETLSGVGDVTLGVSRYFDLSEEDADYPLELEVRASTKLATGDETKGLGTGKTDYTAQLGLTQYIDALSLNITGGYTFIGKMDPTAEQDTAFMSLGAKLKVAQALSLGATYSVEDSVQKTADPLTYGILNASLKLSAGSYLSAYVKKNLTNDAIPTETGVSINSSF